MFLYRCKYTEFRIGKCISVIAKIHSYWNLKTIIYIVETCNRLSMLLIFHYIGNI